MEPRLHGRAEQAPVTDTCVKPGGTASNSDTAVAADGPSFSTVMVWMMFVPAVAVTGPAMLTATSADERLTGVVTKAGTGGSGPFIPSGSTIAVFTTGCRRRVDDDLKRDDGRLARLNDAGR
jgi:hypothetical protein